MNEPEEDRRRQTPITLHGEAGMQVLAHPARALALECLLEGERATATQLAARAGITPSAMSYHLRSLAKLGVIRRVPSDRDSRERLWEATGTSLEILPDGGEPTSPTSRKAAVLRYFNRLVAAMTSLEREDSTNAGTIQYSTLWLTEGEAEHLVGELTSCVNAVTGDDRPDQRCQPEVRPYELWTFLLPRHDPDRDERPPEA